MQLNNPSFKPVEFDRFRRQAGFNKRAVKAVDIFGNDTMTIVAVNV